jgi:hypothetical protein
VSLPKEALNKYPNHADRETGEHRADESAFGF